MSKFLNRKILEEKLVSAIKRGERLAFEDPEVKKKIEGFRQMYEEDDGTMLKALGMPAPSPQSSPEPAATQLPQSKIPELIYILDQIGKTKPQPKKSSKPPLPKKPGIDPAQLKSSVQGTRRPFLPKADEDDLPNQSLSQSARRSIIHDIETEIEQTRSILTRVKQDESAIRNHDGVYAATSTRLKAERLLRELPSKIAYLNAKKQELEQV